jgi:phospholipase/carboxylesterase
MPAPYHALITPPKGLAPLVFAFHGTGGDETQFTALVYDMIPDAGLVAPRGDVSEGGANRYFQRTAEGVYDMADLARRTAAMATFVSGVRAAHPGRAAFALGYSNGANILAAMTFQHADLFDRIALLHPLIPWQPAPNPGLAGRSVLITAGRHDRVAPLGLTEALVGYYRAQGAAVISEVHDGGHDIRPPEIAALTRFLSDDA